LQPI
ncbi:hypothetical protein D049_4171B, partial [Vibrio parahaemolyticus VPTS-2010]